MVECRRVGPPRPRRRSAVLVTAIVLSGAYVGICASGSSASGGSPEAGSLQIVTPTTTGLPAPLSSGGSATAFAVRFPGTPFCPGDSATGNYRISGFMVAASVDVASLTFGPLGPEPSGFGTDEFRQPLYGALSGAAYTSVLTGLASTAGGPGLIPTPPSMSLAVFGPGDVPAGAYRLGVACTRLGAVVRYWSTSILVSSDGADEPAGIAWSVPDNGPPTAATTTSTTTTSTTATTTTTTTTSTTTSVARRCTQTLAFGDSVMRSAQAALTARGLAVNARRNRAMPAKLSAGRATTVVVHLGTDRRFSRSTLDRLVRSLGSRRVVLVTVEAPATRKYRYVAALNRLIRATPSRFSNVRVADWDVVAAPGLLGTDGLSPSVAGVDAYAALIADTAC